MNLHIICGAVRVNKVELLISKTAGCDGYKLLLLQSCSFFLLLVRRVKVSLRRPRFFCRTFSAWRCRKHCVSLSISYVVSKQHGCPCVRSRQQAGSNIQQPAHLMIHACHGSSVTSTTHRSLPKSTATSNLNILSFGDNDCGSFYLSRRGRFPPRTRRPAGFHFPI